MLSTKLMKQLKLLKVRKVHSTFAKSEGKPPSGTSTASEPIKPSAKIVKENIIGSPLHTVSNLDKWILVWVKRYPSMAEVPSQVGIDCIKRAHTLARIRISFFIMGIAIVGFIGSALLGKKDVAAGKNIYTERMKWHKEIKERAKQEAENKGNV